MLLEMRGARYVRGGETIAPQNVALEAGHRHAHACEGQRAAGIVAMLAAGLVRATEGSVFVGAFDPRIQPVHVKQLVGYIPHDPLPYEFPTFERYVEYRAALHRLPAAESLQRANGILESLDGVHESFAYPLVGALIGRPALLVLDRPQAVYAAHIADAAGGAAIFSTHGSQSEASRFAAACAAVA